MRPPRIHRTIARVRATSKMAADIRAGIPMLASRFFRVNGILRACERHSGTSDAGMPTEVVIQDLAAVLATDYWSPRPLPRPLPFDP